MDHNESTHFQIPPALRASARDNDAMKRRCFANRATGAPGGTRRKVLHLLFILFYSSYFNCISLPPPLIPSSIFFLLQTVPSHSALAISHPRLGLDCTMVQLTVIMGGLDDVVVDDVDINDADVAGRMRRIRRLELRSLPRQRWWQAGGGKLGGAAMTTSRERRKA